MGLKHCFYFGHSLALQRVEQFVFLQTGKTGIRGKPAKDPHMAEVNMKRRYRQQLQRLQQQVSLHRHEQDTDY